MTFLWSAQDFPFEVIDAVITQQNSPVVSQVCRPSEFSRLALTKLPHYVKVAHADNHHVPQGEGKHGTCNNRSVLSS